MNHMCLRSCRVLALGFVCGLVLTSKANAQVIVDRTTAIVVDTGESPAVATAADDLASDFEKVFGQKARIVHRREEAGTTAVVIRTSSGDAESFTLSASER